MIKSAGRILDAAIVEHNTGWTELENGGRERVIRCWECGDSDNQNHGHLSISLSPPFLFRCHRCGYSGAVNAEFLSHLGIRLNDTLTQIVEENKELTRRHAASKIKSGSRTTNALISGRFNNRLSAPNYSPKDLEKPSFNYLCERFNHNFDVDDLKKFKAVLNLKRFGRANLIKKWPEKVEVLDVLNSNYIGFQDFSGNYLIFRNIYKDANPRYFEMKFEKSPFRLYTFASEISILTPCLKIAVVEGIFDAIGLYLKLGKPQDTVFVAMLGKNIGTVIDFFFRLGFMSQEIKIYSDNDVDRWKYYFDIKNMEYPKELKFSVSLIYNALDKDFGVPAEKIRFDRMQKLF